MELKRRVLLGAAALAALASPGTAHGQETLVAGVARGCFYLIGGPACTTFFENVNSSSVLPGSNITFDADKFVAGPGAGFSFYDYTSAGQLAVGGNNVTFPANNFGKITAGAPATPAANTTYRFNYGGTTLQTCNAAANPLFPCGRLGIGILVAFSEPIGINSFPAGMPSVQPVYGTISGSISARRVGAVTTTTGGILLDFDNGIQGPFAFTASTELGGAPNAGGPGDLIQYNLNDYNVNASQVGSVPGGILVTVNAVPEPSTYALLATGFVGIFGAARARRRSHG